MSLIRDDDDPRAVLAATCVLAITLLAGVFGCFGAVAHAQEPPTIQDTLEAVRAEFPRDWSHADRGTYLNTVAWIHRAEGWGLLHKPGGNRCPAPQGVDVSCDYLVHRPTLNGYDVLVDETTPTWPASPSDSFVLTPERWIAPVAPSGTLPDPGSPPVTDEVLVRVRLIEQVVAELRQQQLEHETAAAVERAKQEAFRQAVADNWKKVGLFLAKYVAPIVGGLLAGRAL